MKSYIVFGLAVLGLSSVIGCDEYPIWLVPTSSDLGVVYSNSDLLDTKDLKSSEDMKMLVDLKMPSVVDLKSPPDLLCHHDLAVPVSVCGDHVCNGKETCSTCPCDCGKCLPQCNHK